MTMGIVSKGSPCNVQGCDGTAVRSLNTKKVEDAGFRLDSSGKKSGLCKKMLQRMEKGNKRRPLSRTC